MTNFCRMQLSSDGYYVQRQGFQMPSGQYWHEAAVAQRAVIFATDRDRDAPTCYCKGMEC